MRIRTIEDGFQYQMNKVLNQFAKDYGVEAEFQEDAEEAMTKYIKHLANYFLDRISEYCGAQEAYDNEY